MTSRSSSAPLAAHSPSSWPRSVSRSGMFVVRHVDQSGHSPGLAKGKVLHCLPEQFHERVRYVRGSLSRREAGNAWGYSEKTVANWERGKSEPTWSQWQEIERWFLGLDALGSQNNV